MKSVYEGVREKYPLREVRRDDILDSMVLAVAARNGNLTALHKEPDIDVPRIYYPTFEPPSSPIF